MAGRGGAGNVRRARGESPTPPFVWAAAAVAIVGGFGLGAALFGHRGGVWWPAAAQAHGHAQVFGWAGLMVLGVGLHFLPRLRGAPLAGARWAPLVLGLYAGGVALRIVGQPLAAVQAAWGWLLPLSGALELAGAGLAVGLLARTMRGGVPLAQRQGFTHVLPWLALSLCGLGAGLLLNLLGLVAAAATPLALMPAPYDPLVVALGLYGFLAAMCVAVSARSFPLYLRVRLATSRQLNTLLAVYALGLALRLIGLHGAPAWVSAAGLVLLGGALVGAARVVDAPFLRTRAAVLGEAARRAASYGQAPRPLPPRESEFVAADWLLRAAYAWLLVAAALLLLGGLAPLLGVAPPPLDAERHVVGAGFITLLIFGMGVHLLPGFLATRIASARLVWATLVLGNLAALLRVGPPLAEWLTGAALPGAWSASLQGGAGVLGLLAVLLFAVNLWRTWR